MKQKGLTVFLDTAVTPTTGADSKSHVHVIKTSMRMPKTESQFFYQAMRNTYLKR